MHLSCFGIGRAYAARSVARRGEEGLGRRRLPGPSRGDTCRRASRAPYHLATDQAQVLRRRGATAQEPNQGKSAIEGGVALPHLEAHLRIYQGALSRSEEESRMA